MLSIIVIKKKRVYFDDYSTCTVMVDEAHKAKAASIKSILEKCQVADRVFGVGRVHVHVPRVHV